jgi:hypothetical protein
MWAQRVDSRVGGGTVWTEWSLSCVRMKVMPSVGHFLAARSTSPQCAGFGWWREHVVVRHLRMRLQWTLERISSRLVVAWWTSWHVLPIERQCRPFARVIIMYHIANLMMNWARYRWGGTEILDERLTDVRRNFIVPLIIWHWLITRWET